MIKKQTLRRYTESQEKYQQDINPDSRLEDHNETSQNSSIKTLQYSPDKMYESTNVSYQKSKSFLETAQSTDRI